ncbi:MAG: hypothetical protein IH874_04605 [Candidatus Dadabacteria bacterium]|nr:hypothetical protein [Candidatus Dadabacteria bacterium]
MRVWSIVVISMIFVLPTGISYGSSSVVRNQSSALGFEFGMSEKKAKKRIESRGRRIVQNTVDSKKIRTIVVDGAFVEVPFDVEGLNIRTRLEFWDKDLVASSLLIEASDTQSYDALSEQLTDYMIDRYGRYRFKESFMNTTTLTWHLKDVSVVLSSNPRKIRCKIEYTFKSLYQDRKADEYDKAQRPDTKDAAKDMFLK